MDLESCMCEIGKAIGSSSHTPATSSSDSSHFKQCAFDTATGVVAAAEEVERDDNSVVAVVEVVLVVEVGSCMDGDRIEPSTDVGVVVVDDKDVLVGGVGELMIEKE